MSNAGERRGRILAAWGEPAATIMALVFAVGVAALAVVQSSTRVGLDLGIYRSALDLVNQGKSVYDFLDKDGNGFVYPPFAALIMQPIRWAPIKAVVLPWNAVQMATVALTVWALVRAVRREKEGHRSPVAWRDGLVAAAALLLAALSFPVLENLRLGQVSVAVAALALIDACGWLPRRFRGILVGIAAAIKLTPLIFLPYYLITKQWANLVRASVTFVVCGLIGLVYDPAGSLRFWANPEPSGSEFIQGLVHTNASIVGVIGRLGITGTANTVLWLLVGGALVLLALWRSRRHVQRGEFVSAALTIGLVSTVVTPKTWSHHMLWQVAAGLVLLVAVQGWRRVLGVITLVVMSPTWFNFFSSTDRALVRHLVVDVFSLMAVALVVLGLPTRPDPADPAAPDPGGPDPAEAGQAADRRAATPARSEVEAA